ncbi:hypothetical protein B0T25DRAFT_590382 [Lasiosphaeria hispida]|uniref:Enoyl reductase (ER) domain-containing protein n=1 Tax=Lasiosphaeria hispida TaxID=260671 RepID=A0AAJ0HGY0_9PEZI|nr:hypothetical protein B0T25DRAFT_590382 [Lasiosphaeria hispida]
MRAWQYSTAAGGLEKNLTLHNDVPLPPLSTRPTDAEILVEVLSASLNPADYKVPELGLVARAMIRLPATPGMDFCGRVAQTTPAARDAFPVGALVFGRLDATQHGTCAGYTVAPAASCALVPEGVEVDWAASVGCAGQTAFQPIAQTAKAGDRVFINGGSGGTGTFGIQIAKALGCHVSVSCSTGKVALCKSLGADEVFDYTATDVVQALKEGGATYALCVDNVGEPAGLYQAAHHFLLPAGKFVQVGAGTSWEAAKTLTSRLLLPSFMGGGKRKFEFFRMTGNKPEDLEQMAKWMADGTIKPVIEEVFEFEDLPKAFAKLRQGRNAGKFVIHVGK